MELTAEQKSVLAHAFAPPAPLTAAQQQAFAAAIEVLPELARAAFHPALREARYLGGSF